MTIINRYAYLGIGLLALCFCEIAMAQDPGSVTRVVYGSAQAPQGEFRKVNGASWVEQSYQSGNFNFQQNGVDPQSVHLYDASRDTHIVLDIARKQIFYRQGNNQPVPIYNIVSVEGGAPPQQAVASSGGGSPAMVVAPRPPAEACDVHSGQSVVIAQIDHTRVMHASKDANGNIVAGQNQCGWYGCRVAMFGGGNEMRLNHGEEAPFGYPETFSLVKEGGQPGACLRYGDEVKILNNQGQYLYMDDRGLPRPLRLKQGDGSTFYLRVPVQDRSTFRDGQPLGFPSKVVLSLTSSPGDTDCGWYGCRVLRDTNQLANVEHGKGGLGGYPDGFFLYPPICGAQNQPACVGGASDACKAGLAPDPLTNLCENAAVVKQHAEAIQNGGPSDPMAALGSFAFDIISNQAKMGYIIDGRFGRDLQNGRLDLIDQNLGLTALAAAQFARMTGPFRSISVGAGADGGLVAGIAGDMGVMVDLSARPQLKVYRSFSLQAGLIAGVGVSASIGISTNTVNEAPGESNALSGGASPVSLTMTFNSQTGQPDGGSVSVGASISPKQLALPIDARASTSLTQLYIGGPTDNAASWDGGKCGGNGDRPCHFVERIPSCSAGLKENFLKHTCIPVSEPIRPLAGAALPATSPNPAGVGIRADLLCGAEGQRPCTLGERIPSCDAGLKEDFIKGRCVR